MLISGLTAVFAYPGFTAIVRHHHAAAVINALIGNVHFARHSAISFRAHVTLCAGDQNGCFAANQWHRGTIIFLDRDADGTLGAEEKIIQRSGATDPDGRIYWRSFRNRAYLQFAASGLSNWQSGHFLYCPADANMRFARQVILNARGRARLARDTDGDGIAEDARGHPLICPAQAGP